MSSETETLNNSTNKRKAGGAGAKSATKKASKSVSAHETFFDTLQQFQKANGYIGQLLIKGISASHCDDEEDEDDEDTSKYTKEQMESLRMIQITQNRADKLEEMRELILGDQADSGMLMFNTSFSYTVHDSLFTLRQMLTKTKDVTKKLDLLMAYTFTVKEYDTWLHDNEGDMDEFTTGLATIWKRLMKKSHEDLGIDKEYTRPALVEMLSQFKEQIDDCDGDMQFKYM